MHTQTSAKEGGISDTEAAIELKETQAQQGEIQSQGEGQQTFVLPKEVQEMQSYLIMLVAAMVELEKKRKKRSYEDYLAEGDDGSVWMTYTIAHSKTFRLSTQTKENGTESRRKKCNYFLARILPNSSYAKTGVSYLNSG